MDYKLVAVSFLAVLTTGLTEGRQNDSDIQEYNLESLNTEKLLHISRRIQNPLIKLLVKSFVSLEKKFNNVENLVKEANIERQLNETSRVENVLELKINETEQKLEHMINDRFDELAKEICSLYTCSEWSEWSPCDAVKFGEYGLKNRTRECGRTGTSCPEGTETMVETKNDVCQTVCTPGYSMTDFGYCVKLYKSIKKSRDNAEKQCQTDGGHLINIDSFLKSVDITEMVENEEPERVWIGGIQRSSGGEWEFSYGSVNSNFSNWHHDQPNESTFPNCMYLLPNAYEWADYPCYHEYSFLCEIVPN